MSDPISPDITEAGRPRLAWLPIPCAVVAIVCALVPFTGLRALGAPLWLAVVAAVIACPGLALLWHWVAERTRRVDNGGRPAFLARLALRALAVGLVVLAVSLSNLGPRAVGANLLGLVRPRPSERPTPAAPAARPPARPPASPVASRHELEPFIPADATGVVALSDSAAMGQLLATSGADTADKVAALQKCQILMGSARVLIASRDRQTRLIVVRAPGVTDPRNLYCLAGVLGSERLRLRFSSDKAPVRFEVEGVVPRPLRFAAADDRTVVAIDGPWGDAAERKLFAGGEAATGPLADALARVDRGASLWSASVFATEKGAWDLALDARFDGGHLRVRASSIPPAGSAEKAEVETRVPLAFVSALPAKFLQDGVRGMIALLASAGKTPSPPATPPTKAARPEPKSP